VTTSFPGATQDALDVHLGAEPDNVGGFGQLLTGLFPGRQRRTSLGVGEGLGAGVLHRQSPVGVDKLIMVRPPDLVIGRGDDLP
jgi:hypothetical protein